MTQHSSFAAGAKFTEAQLETAIIELLGKEGYPHVLSDTYKLAEISKIK